MAKRVLIKGNDAIGEAALRAGCRYYFGYPITPQSELLEYRNTGVSVMEMSHRAKAYDEIIKGAEAALRRLMEIPPNYKILFLQGGASLQFAMVPMNLMRIGRADYIVTGQFASKAQKEGMKYGEARIAASSADRNFSYIPELPSGIFDPSADYVHICTNNTIYGTSYRVNLPDVGRTPLVADASSNIISEEMDVSRFGLIYAGAQKNIGIPGLTVVIVREDLLRDDLPRYVPTMMSYKVMADNDSLYNTPPTYAIYIAKLVFEYIESLGGIPAIQRQNEYKAALLYDCLDNANIVKGTADRDHRSIMNVTFVTGKPELDEKFVREAEKHALHSLKGHRSVGGMRASIYNAMPVEGVQELCEFIKEFDKRNS
jgi:phosphoserine aminotransferase